MGYSLAGQFKVEDNLIMELDKRFSAVESVLGKMVKTGSVIKLGQARATKYVNAKYIKGK